MTTSRETEQLHHPAIRRLVDAAAELGIEDRVTLLKGLIPGIARELSRPAFDGLIVELDLKGKRYYEALENPGLGRATRRVPGDREVEER